MKWIRCGFKILLGKIQGSFAHQHKNCVNSSLRLFAKLFKHKSLKNPISWSENLCSCSCECSQLDELQCIVENDFLNFTSCSSYILHAGGQICKHMMWNFFGILCIKKLLSKLVQFWLSYLNKICDIVFFETRYRTYCRNWGCKTTSAGKGAPKLKQPCSVYK